MNKMLLSINLFNLIIAIIGSCLAILFSEIAFKLIDKSMKTVNFEDRLNKGDFGAWMLRLGLFWGIVYLVAHLL